MGKSTIALLLTAVSISSCGIQQSRPKNNVSDYQRQTTHPVRLTKQYDKCSRVQAQSSNKNFELDLHMDGYGQVKKLNFSDLLFGRNLKKSNIITSTSFNYEDQTLYKIWWSSLNDQWEVEGGALARKVISNESSIQICPGYTDYTGSSFESAALSINYIISKTNKAVLQSSSDLKIDPVTIKVAPLYGKKYVGREGNKRYIYTMYDTDNAFYRPSDKTIQFLPQSEEGLEDNVFGSKPLWQIPMVASHEYGHHLFSMIYPKYKEYYENSVVGHENCFDSSGNVSHDHSASNEEHSISRSPKEVDNIRSLNEGFADLVSFYTLDSNERGLNNITCMETSRDVDSSYFADGTPKVFNKKVRRIFYSWTKEISDNNCNTPNFQDIHLTGAIFAHAVDELLSSFTSDKSLKLKTVINWLKRMNIEHKNIKGAYMDQQFEIAFSLFVKTMLNDFGKVEDRRICDKVDRYFPEASELEYNDRYYLKECRNH